MNQQKILIALTAIGLFVVVLFFPSRSHGESFWKILLVLLIVLFVAKPLVRRFGPK